MTEYTTKDIVNFATQGKPSKVQHAVTQVLAARINDAIDVKKQEVAANLFGSGEDKD
tara:strand:+ start:479 stop:649 length:171 start_codon:yes stop_codon:yes gene_type:complete